MAEPQWPDVCDDRDRYLPCTPDMSEAMPIAVTPEEIKKAARGWVDWTNEQNALMAKMKDDVDAMEAMKRAGYLTGNLSRRVRQTLLERYEVSRIHTLSAQQL